MSAVGLVVVGLGGGGALLLALWSWLSLRHRRSRPPADDAAVRAFQERTFRELGCRVDLERACRHSLVVSDGVRLQLYVIERGETRPTIVFMPGTAVYAEFYAPLLEALAERGFNVVAFDPRGHGRSGGPRGDFSIDRMVRDALSVVEWAADRYAGPVGLAGSSQGGVCALYAAAHEHPALDAVCCHNFTLLDGRTNLEVSTIPVPRWAVRPLAELLKRITWLAVPVTVYLPFDRLRVPSQRSAVELMRSDPLVCRAYSLRALGSLAHTPLPKPLSAIRTPVMLLGSTEDEVFPAPHVESIFERLRGPKRYVNLEGLPHLIYFYRVDEVADAIADWFRSPANRQPLASPRPPPPATPPPADAGPASR